MSFDIERFPTSEAAVRMMGRISPIYDRSYVGKWIFQVMGAEMDFVRDRYLELRDQAFPETATWAIQYWEQRYGIIPNSEDTLQTRRNRILAYRSLRVPMNPARMQKIVRDYSGLESEIDENTDDYTFTVLLLQGPTWTDPSGAVKRLHEVKQTHKRMIVKTVRRETSDLHFYTGVAERVGIAYTIGCNVPPSMDIDYLVDENGTTLTDELGNRYIDNEEGQT